MEDRRCAACGQLFRPHPQVPRQSYCSVAPCQRERRKRWQRDKLQQDPDYRDNQSRAQRAWLDRNPHYWRNYRDEHPEYAERNRQQQRERSAAASVCAVAKMDEWTVEITPLSVTCPCATPYCKEMTSWAKTRSIATVLPNPAR